MMNAQPLVSVIVPVYNVEPYLPRCIDSILSQTYSDFELLLIDDGSSDNSGRICDEYAEKDGRIRVFHKENGGVCSARNVGLDNANGKWFFLFDSDDMVSPLLMEHCMKAVSENELDCFIYGYQTVAPDASGPVICGGPEPEMEYMDAESALRTALIGSKFRMLCCNKIYSRHLWEGIRFPVGRKYGDDTAVTYRLLDKCRKIGYQNIPFYCYRMNPESALHKSFTKDNFQLFDAYDELLDFIRTRRNSLMKIAYYSYAIRIFDTLPRIVKSENAQNYTEILSSYTKGKTVHFMFSPITIKQKALLVLLRLFPRFFCALWTKHIGRS